MGKTLGEGGWMVGTELKGSIDNTNDLKWTINHISSSQHLPSKNARPAQTVLKKKRGKCLKEPQDLFFITPTNSFPNPAS